MRTVVCVICGKPFTTSSHGRPVTCSEECHREHRRRQSSSRSYERVCRSCGVSFVSKKRGASLCPKCHWSGRRKPDAGMKKCPVCGKEFEAHHPNRIFCSDECYRVHLRERDRARSARRSKTPERKAYERDWRARNKEHLSRRRVEYANTNFERIREYRRRYYADHSDEVKERVRDWEKANPERARKHHASKERRRKARKRRTDARLVINAALSSASKFELDMQSHASLLASGGIVSI